MKLPLSKTEKFCRDYYLKHGKVTHGILSSDGIESENTPADSRHRLFLDMIRDFHEDLMIPAWSDVWILTTPRYMPVLPHSHDFIELIFVYNGSCIHDIANYSEILTEGDLYILPPDLPHRIECYNDDSIVFHIMVRKSTFDSSFIDLLRTHSALSDFFITSIYTSGNTFIRFATKNDQNVKEIVWSIYEESLTPNDYTAPMMNTLFRLLCLHLAKHHLSNLVVKNQKQSLSLFPDILEFIATNYNTVTLSMLADHFNYSEGHMRRLVRQATGKSLKEVITDQRLIHARLLLVSSSLKITDIASETGFGDVRTMQRLFKEKYGKPPSAYRE